MEKIFYLGRCTERRRKKLGEEGRKGEINESIQHLYQTNRNRKQLYLQNCGALEELFSRNSHHLECKYVSIAPSYTPHRPIGDQHQIKTFYSVTYKFSNINKEYVLRLKIKRR
jgi:hypothetical protein